MKQFHLHPALIDRDSERTFFDKKRFRILRFNHSGFDILRVRLNGIFTHADFVRACAEEGVSEAEARTFWQKCITNDVVVAVSI
jgi:hypothetical protein